MHNSGFNSGLGKVISVNDIIGQLTEFESGLWVHDAKFCAFDLVTVLWLFKIKPLFFGSILRYLGVKRQFTFKSIKKIEPT